MAQNTPFNARQELFGHIATLLEGVGTTVGADIEALMKPLLNGTMTFDEHRALLEAELKALIA